MVMLEIMQKTIRMSMELMVMELGRGKGKGFWSFVPI